MPVYPGTEKPVFRQGTTIEKEGFAEKKLTLNSHTGTHIDAPAHLLPQGATLDSLPLTHFTGTAVVVDVRVKGEIAITHFNLVRQYLKQCDFILFNTGWDKYWGKSQYFEHSPVLALETAKWLATLGLKGVGIDAISFDPVSNSDLPVHKILLGKGMILVENLTNLADLPRTTFRFICLPLKIKDAEGSPVRAIALTDNEQ
jgi:arylformamidase